MKAKLLAILALLLIPLLYGEIKNEINFEEVAPGPDYFLVTKVVDGDTIKVKINSEIETIRLIGIDTPETVDPRKTVQCFGLEASTKAKQMLAGKWVRLEADYSQDDRDSYDRLLRYVYLEDGVFFNKYMISEGFAHEYTYKSNPYLYQADFIAAENEARINELGLWHPDSCNGYTE